MRFDIITIFPNIFSSYFSESIIGRAQKAKLVEINVHNLRDYTFDKHKKVDDTPYGGGAGMVLKIQPIFESVTFIKSQPKAGPPMAEKVRTILFSAKGKKYTQADARRLAKYDQLIFICGRYEGVDERVAGYISDEEISIGDYVLTGGEIPAMILVDSITRLIPGVLGNEKSLEEESFNHLQAKSYKLPPKADQPLAEKTNLEYPQYTKPEKFFAEGESASGGWKVPEVLLSGNHKKIKDWRSKNAEIK